MIWTRYPIIHTFFLSRHNFVISHPVIWTCQIPIWTIGIYFNCVHAVVWLIVFRVSFPGAVGWPILSVTSHANSIVAR